MNTYFTAGTPDETARSLDRQRLGKQRIEANQIAEILLGLTARAGWRNHPIVAAWRPYPGYLVHEYLRAMHEEWERRGYRNDRMRERYSRLIEHVPEQAIRPRWVTGDLIGAHRAYLLRRAPEHYRRMWPDAPDNLPLRWP